MKKYLLFIIIIILIIVSTIISYSNENNENDKDIELISNFAGKKQILTDEQLRQFIPNDIITFKNVSSNYQIHKMTVQILPVKDSVGLRIDTISESPKYVLLLYSTGSSVLEILELNDGEYTVHWISPEVNNCGNVYLQDLNGDNKSEIIVSMVNQNGFEGLYILSWDSGNTSILNPSGKMNYVSEISGFIKLKSTDTGTTIKTYHPTSQIEKVFQIENNSFEINLIQEKKIKKKMEDE